jgi:hypothetical protein
MVTVSAKHDKQDAIKSEPTEYFYSLSLTLQNPSLLQMALGYVQLWSKTSPNCQENF